MSKHYETHLVHQYSLIEATFQWHQEQHDKRCPGLGDLNVTNKTN